jgi:hypothetical protein
LAIKIAARKAMKGQAVKISALLKYKIKKAEKTPPNKNWSALTCQKCAPLGFPSSDFLSLMWMRIIKMAIRKR